MVKKLSLAGAILLIAVAALFFFSANNVDKKTSPIEDMAMSAG